MRNSPKSVENFFNKMSIDNLTKYQDPKGKLARSLKIAGLPLTILLNKDNKKWPDLLAMLIGLAHML